MGRHFRAIALVAAALVMVPWATGQAVSFARLEAIGDSLTINTQGGMVSDHRNQVKGWAPLLAAQAGTTMRLPLLEEMNAIGQQRRQDYPDYQHCQNYAYNGVSTDDVFMKVTPEIPAIQFGWSWNHLDLICADRPGYTMLQALKEDDPTFVVGFLGSNDFMERVMATGTMLEGLPLLGLAEEVSPLDASNLRPQDMFRSDFETVVSTLYKPGIGMCFGTLPVLPDIPGIMNKQELTEFVGPNSLPDDCYTNYTVAACVRGGLKGTDSFADDRNYYTPAELQTINDAITGYNTTIRNAGANPAHPFCVVETPIQDPRTMTNDLHVNGWRIDNQIFTSALGKPRATIMSTDGVHMTDIGNALCANRYISAINAYYGTSIPELNEAQLTDILNRDNFADNDGDGEIEGISCGVFFLTLNFVYPNETGDSDEVPRNAKVLTTGAYPPSGGSVAVSAEGPEYWEGTTLTVTANPATSTGAVFSHWEGDIPEGFRYVNAFSVTMDAHKTANAYFDAEPPTITCPADKSVAALPGTCTATVPDWTGEAFLADDASRPDYITVTQEPAPGTQLDASGNPHTITLTAEDEVGLKSQCTFLATVTDQEAPSFTMCAATKTLGTDPGACYATAQDWTGEPTAQDNCSAPESITFTQDPPPGSPLDPAGNPHTITLTARDEAGNTARCTFQATVMDSEGPTVICPENKIFNTEPGKCRATAQDWTAEAVISDNCTVPGGFTVIQTPRPGTQIDAAGGPRTVTITALDAAGNSSQSTFLVTVVDDEAPTVTCPADKKFTTPAGTCQRPAQDWTSEAVITDNCWPSLDVTVTQDPPAGTPLDVAGSPHTITLTATDESGNTGNCTFTVTIAEAGPPSITCPGDRTLTADSGACGTMAPDWTSEAIISDNCSPVGYVTVTQTPAPGTPLNVAGSPYTVTLTAQDQSGNTTECTFLATVVDEEAPAIVCPADINIDMPPGACQATAREWSVLAVVTDNCTLPGNITVTQTPPAGAPLDAEGSPHTVTLTAEDEAGNTSACTFTVTVEDEEAPGIACPAGKSLNASNGACGITAQDWTGEAVVSDNCAALIVVTQTPPSGTVLDVSGSPHTITLTAKDGAGNSSECSFTVNVNDVEAPVITCPADQILSADPGTCSATAPDWTVDAVVSDNCTAAGEVLVTQTPSAATLLQTAANPHTVTLTATDAAGNTSECSFIVHVTGNPGPCDTTVPNVVGQTQEAAVALLAAADLALGTVTQECSDTVAAGLILRQDPLAGTLALSGSTVAVVISTGPCMATVPDVVGKTQEAAVGLLEAAGLAVGEVTQECSNTLAAGLVISQLPTAQTQAPLGSAVALVVSSGPCDVTVPDVVGETRDDAEGLLEAADLAVGTVTEECSNTVAVGLVISQTPAAETQAPYGSAVALVVSTGPCNVTVPGVVGETTEAAEILLDAANLIVGAVTEECSNTVAAGLVISQTPAAETQAPFGSAVALVVSTGPCNVIVPNVVGLAQAAAATTLTDANLALGTVTEECSNTVAAGLVVSQTPPAGTEAPFGSAVALAVSTGPCSVTVPNVVGLAQSAAVTALTGANLTLGTLTEECNNTVAAGLVISQSPLAGTQAPYASAVALVVSTGPCNVTVPDVAGQTQAAAEAALTAADLTLGTVTQACSNTVAAGLVISQTPAGGTLAPFGSAVALVVSTGPCDVTVPDVVGQTQAAAAASLTAANLLLGTVTEACSNTVAAGLVISQNPAAGSPAPFGSAVAVTVSTGPCNVVVPYVVGQTQAAAGAALLAANLTAGTVTEQCSNTVAAGSVISQNPLGGTQAPFGSAVALVVSTGLCGVTVPNVVGMTQAAAGAALSNVDLWTGAITQECSDTFAAGLVISQNPAAGQQATFGSAVALVVSSGPCGVTVPDVLGQSQATATADIIGAGLVVGTVADGFSNTVPIGYVMAQTPSGGVQVAPGSAVNLVVCRGLATIMPNVLGMTRAEAELAIEEAYLVVGQVVNDFSDTVPAGRVLSQSPPGGDEIARGVTVSFVVSLGPKVIVPDVMGMTVAEAQAALSAAGLLSQIVEETDDTVTAGQLMRQEPAAGTAVALGSTVTLVVSAGPEDGGCGCAGCTGAKNRFTLDGMGKTLGDLFLFGLGVMVMTGMSRFRR